jgi:hypothetical protein
MSDNIHARVLEIVQERLRSYAPRQVDEDAAAAPKCAIVSKAMIKLMLADIDETILIDDRMTELIQGCADDFLAKIIGGSCEIAKRKKAPVLVSQDLAVYQCTANREYSNKRARATLPKK